MKPYLSKTIFLIIIIIVAVLGAKSYSYINSYSKLSDIIIINPNHNSNLSGIVKISAKTIGAPSNLFFALKKSSGEQIAQVKAYFEPASREWVYYWNTIEAEDGDYKIEVWAYDKEKKYLRDLDIKISNHHKIKRNAQENTFSPEKETAMLEPSILKNKKEDNNSSSENNSKNITATQTPENTMLSQVKDIESSTLPTSAGNGKDEKILLGVIKALSNIYDNIETNLTPTSSSQVIYNPEKNENPIKPSGIVAGESVEKNITTTTATQVKEKTAGSIEGNNWFKYNIKITSHEDKDIISSKTSLSALSNNPLDSLDFIFDNPDTSEIDYTFRALNNYGYYTYWTYMLDPKILPQGEYFVSAKGSIDGHIYQSPLITLSIK